MSNYQQGWRPPQQPQQQPAPYTAQPGYYPQQPPAQYQTPMQNVAVNVAPGGAATTRSYFDGGVLQHLGLSIVNALIVVLTLGICTPWAICRHYRWVQKHTVIEGRRLRFDGTAAGLFGLWIKWFLLCLVTLGIYSFWVSIDLQKWIVKHTSFEA